MIKLVSVVSGVEVRSLALLMFAMNLNYLGYFHEILVY